MRLFTNSLIKRDIFAYELKNKRSLEKEVEKKCKILTHLICNICVLVVC